MKNKIDYMKKALKQAQKAFDKGEVPIGCVIVLGGKVIARGYNKRQKSRSALWHAEMVAIDKACKRVGDWRLSECDLYVTLEPCAMCVGACVNARIKNVYFGAYDENGGCCGSVTNLPQVFQMNHKLNCLGGIMQDECKQILQRFFSERRIKHTAESKN